LDGFKDEAPILAIAVGQGLLSYFKANGCILNKYSIYFIK
jgi:hypothetical protein